MKTKALSYLSIFSVLLFPELAIQLGRRKKASRVERWRERDGYRNRYAKRDGAAAIVA